MLYPDPPLVLRANDDIARRLGVALNHLVGDVLNLPLPVRWSTAPAAYAVQDRLRLSAMADDFDAIRDLHARYSALLAAPDHPGQRIRSWGDGMTLGETELLQHAFSDDIGLTAQLMPAEPAVAARVARDVARLQSCLTDVLPLWGDEFTALVRDVILARSGADGFGGASAFSAWGAILVNPQRQRDDLTLLMTLIHESSHLKLFIAYLDDEIVLNDPDARFSSPLRREGRPMNGLFHAAYVLARMICLLQDMRRLGGAGFDGITEAQLDEMSVPLSRQFAEAHAIIAAKGQLTERGRAIFAEAAAAVGIT